MSFFSPRNLLIATALALLVVASCTSELRLFLREGVGEAEAASDDSATSDRIDVDIEVVGVDPVSDRMTLELKFSPHGRFDAGGGLLAVPIEVDVSDVGGDALAFGAGRRMFSHEVQLALDGDVAAYPWDHHLARLELLAEETSGEGGGRERVPLRLDFEGHRHGYVFREQVLPEAAHGYVGFEIAIARSPLVVWPAVFCMAIMWGLTVINLFLLWAVVVDRIEVDLTLFGYMSGLIVALYFFREVLPDVPPFLGTLADYVAFFWSELVTALISLAFAIIWFRKMIKPATKAAE